MKKLKIVFIGLFVILALMIGLWFLNFRKNTNSSREVLCIKPARRDLQQIINSGKLIAVIDFSPTNYFVYKGIPMGFHYDMLQDLAKNLGLQLEVKVESDIEKMIDLLQSGQVDIIGMDMASTLKRQEVVSFVNPHFITRQVLVQRLPSDYQSMSNREIEHQLVRKLLDLRNKEIYVPANTSFLIRLENLQEEIGGKIEIVTSPTMGVEQLIEMVARGDIDYTVCDEHLAKVETNYYQNIDIQTALSFEQEVSWAVGLTSPYLLDAINLWQKKFMESRKYSSLLKKYYDSSRSTLMVRADFNSVKGGRISEYDKLIRTNAELIEWDWRLLASLIYQESNFKHDLTSWAGAWGLMQLMPITSIKFGADSFATPEENIKAGVKFIKWIDKHFSYEIPAEERVKFVLASYNVGMGHILDAQKLARKYGKNPNLWEQNTALYLELKSRPQYYLDPIVKSGFCRGKDVTNFVDEVLIRYNHYKNVVSD